MTSTRLPIDRLLAPFREFAQTSSAGGLVLIACTALALAWANSPVSDSYDALWDTKLTIGVGGIAWTDSVRHWINDALMAIFFLVVGLEIKREVLVGELASIRRATLPIAGAIGGAVAPALVFLLIAGGGDGARGWGIPMATDIAFALGVLALLGSRVPLGLRVVLAALAIADDLIAVLVIAVFYTDQLSLDALAAAGGLLGLLVVANRFGVRSPLVYGAIGIALWAAVLQSGIHGTIAGVLLALTIPAQTRVDSDAFVARARDIVSDFEGRTVGGEDASTEEHHAALWELESVTEKAQAPMLRIEHALHPWVAFVVLPLFALANAGVPIEEVALAVGDPIAVGVLLGLVFGKQIGITLAAVAVVRLGLASLPPAVTWRHMYGAAWLGGIGFTMSLFIGSLAYGDGPTLDVAKIGILGGSILAAAGGYAILRWWAPQPAS